MGNGEEVTYRIDFPRWGIQRTQEKERKGWSDLTSASAERVVNIETECWLTAAIAAREGGRVVFHEGGRGKA